MARADSSHVETTPRRRRSSLAEDALKVQRLLVNNPRELGLADALAIYRAAY